MELYKNFGGDINRRGLSFVSTDEFIEVLEEKGYTRETVSKMTGMHVNTIYNIYNRRPVVEQTARKVCGVLGVLFEEGFEPSKPIKGLSNKTIKHHHRLISAILSQEVFWQVIPNTPANRVKPPRVPRTEAKYLDEKGKSSLMIFDRHANLKYKYGNRTFGVRGYYVDTVGCNKEKIKEYIKNQLEQDQIEDQMSIKEFIDPFTGSKNSKA